MKRGPRILGVPALGPCYQETRRAAFSLIELLMVLVLLLIVTTMYWASSSDSSHSRQLKACQKNLQKLFIAMEIYANDHAGKFPELAEARTAEAPLDMLVPHYTV